MTEHSPNPPAHLPTYVILAAMLTILAWELEVAQLLMAWAGKRIVDPVTHAALLAVSLSLTAFAIVKGHQELAKIQRVRGRVLLTRWQAFLVIVMLIGFGAFGVWVLS